MSSFANKLIELFEIFDEELISFAEWLASYMGRFFGLRLRTLILLSWIGFMLCTTITVLTVGTYLTWYHAALLASYIAALKVGILYVVYQIFAYCDGRSHVADQFLTTMIRTIALLLFAALIIIYILDKYAGIIPHDPDIDPEYMGRFYWSFIVGLGFHTLTHYWLALVPLPSQDEMVQRHHP